MQADNAKRPVKNWQIDFLAPFRRDEAVFVGMLYFAIVFTFAFAMGVIRTLIIAPRLGTTVAVLIEVPILLLASWGVARRLLRHRPLSFSQRVAVGTTAFAFTMVSEAVLAALLRGQSVTQWAHEVATPLGLVGLAGQLGFAAMPIFVGSRSRVVFKSG